MLLWKAKAIGFSYKNDIKNTFKPEFSEDSDKDSYKGEIFKMLKISPILIYLLGFYCSPAWCPIPIIEFCKKQYPHSGEPYTNLLRISPNF